jgi:hypothetical protein
MGHKTVIEEAAEQIEGLEALLSECRTERDRLARDVTAAYHAIDRLVSQFEGIADDKWPTEGMQIAVRLCAEWMTGSRGEG